MASLLNCCGRHLERLVKKKRCKDKPVGNQTLEFAINGEEFKLSSVDPSTTLLQFLRSQTKFKSVKLSCGEGGCGACTVLLSKYDPKLDQVEDCKISSCLTLLCSVNGCSITTSEGLGNSKDGFHPIHQRFAGFHASQCGFCTPGMCVSLFSALVNAEKTDRPKPPKGFSKLSVSEAEKSVSGNLCRCTGYRPIADVCKSFSGEVDIEDLGINSFWKKDDPTDVKVSKLPFYDLTKQICTYPEFLKKECGPLLLNQKEPWYTPVTIKELCSLLETCSSENSAQVKLVAGNTGAGYYKEIGHFSNYIDIRYIPELAFIRCDDKQIEIGATVTISKTIIALREEKADHLSSKGEPVFKKLADHLEKVATETIRNSASIGGNLVMAQRNHFPSDIATVLLAVDTNVKILTGFKEETLTLEEFLARPALDFKSVLLSVRIPFWKPLQNGFYTDRSDNLMFETYRASPRPLGNALAYLNASFLADVSHLETGVVINSIKLSFGAYGTKHSIRARNVEEYLATKIISINVLYEAVKLIRNVVSPDQGTSDPAYRSSLAVGFLFEFLSPLMDACAGINTTLDNSEFDHNGNWELLSSAKQVLEPGQDYHPVREPISKSGAALQASGEAIYVDDIPSPTNCLHGAFICSTKPIARVKAIKFKGSSLPDGVEAVISCKDVPEGGENVGTKTSFGYVPLFADGIVEYAGQPLALVVADSQKNADIAAGLAVIDYDTENVGPPILTVEQAVEKSSFFSVPPFLSPSPVGEFTKGMDEAEKRILSAEIRLGSQYYFYMETQTALAVPDEDNCMVIYSSTQFPEGTHSVIARCLGVPEHNIRVITRRVGGGFGGKAYKAMPIATACALAAHKLRRPVRLYLNRKTDMIMAGGRHPMKINYSVGFKSNGKITALHLDILINAGCFTDIGPGMPLKMVGALKKYDWGALSFDFKVCKTNHSGKSAMRAPGEVQASFIAEAVIEHVASVLSLEVDSVRHRNLHTLDSLSLFYPHSKGEPIEYTLPSIWDKLGKSSSFQRRVEMVKKFNLSNKWKQKGISRVPIIHEVTVRSIPGKVSILGDGSIVVEVGGIELGQGLWTKVKQMTAFGLSTIHCEGFEEFLEKVRVIQADTLSLIHGGVTAGSTTSESSCEAVRLCCNILVERLSPLKKTLEEQMASVTWDALILQAQHQSVSLTATSLFVPDSTSTQYLNYGAAVCEVEIDLLTGGTNILEADIIYDCGQSLNPAVDLGQIEGAFIQGIGFYMLEEYLTNSEGSVAVDGTWNYKIPTLDTIPKQFNVELMNSGHHQKRVLSSKASGEPPLLLAVSAHCATRAAIKEAKRQLLSWDGSDTSDSIIVNLDVPATMPIVKMLCGLENVESYLQSLLPSS